MARSLFFGRPGRRRRRVSAPAFAGPFGPARAEVL